MHRLARLLRSDRGALALWALSTAVALAAALAGQGLVLGLALVVSYVADARLFLDQGEVLQWLNRRQLATAQRALLRQLAAVLGWVALARPDAWLAAAVVAGLAATHLAHAAYRVLSGRNARLRRGRLGWANLDVGGQTSGPEVLPPTLPPVATITGPRVALHTDVPLLAGLWLGWTLGSDLPVLLGLALLVAGVAFVAFRVVARRRTILALPTPEEDNARLLEAVRELAPEVAVYFSGGPGTTYQLNVWLETIDRLHRPAVIILREFLHLEELLPTSTPVLVLPKARDVEFMQVPSITVALYPTTVIKNNHMIRLRGIRHVFINHGDGDKAVTYSPLHRVFDEIWVAGQAACDRYLRRGEGVRPEQLVTVGRPQLAHIEARPGPVPAPSDERPVTVLYAPTWEGNFDGVDYSSVAPMGERLVDGLLTADVPVRVLFKAHPATGTRLPRAAAARAAIEDRLRAAGGGHEVVGTEPDALYRAFNEADLLVADISSVVADFLASRKPYLVTNPRDVAEADFHRDFPSTAGAGIIARDCSNLASALHDALGADVLRERREELATYFLGAPVADPVEHFADEVDRACERAEQALERSARAAAELAAEETA
jgi:hypothetical protein